MPRASLIYNPVAGRYPSRILVDRAVKLFNQKGWEISVEQSHTGEHITQAARNAASVGDDVFIVVGGDGSVNYALTGLIGSQTALGVLPAGTANVWAQELCMEMLGWTRWFALENCSRALIDGSVCEVDVGICNGQPFLLWAGIGLDGYIVNNIEPRNRWKKTFSILHYGASAIWYANQWKGTDIEIEVDGKKIEGHYLLVLVSNIHLYAGGVIQLPTDYHLDDGMMDLWLIEGDHIGDTLHIVWDLLTHSAENSHLIRRIPFKNLCLITDVPLFGQLDGEPSHPVDRMEINVKPRALRVIVPQSISKTHFQSEPLK